MVKKNTSPSLYGDVHGYKCVALLIYVLLTFAHGQGAAPLSVESALSASVSAEDVTFVTGEVDNIIEVELAAIGPSVGWVAGVTTSDG